MQTIKQINRTACLAVASLALVLAACAHRPGEPMSQAWSDKMTSRRVNAQLKESPTYKFPTVEVTTHDGVVALSGFVNNDAQKQEAIRRAQAAVGVRQVVDNLVIQMMPTGRPPVVEHPRTINPQNIPQTQGTNMPPEPNP